MRGHCWQGKASAFLGAPGAFPGRSQPSLHSRVLLGMKCDELSLDLCVAVAPAPRADAAASLSTIDLAAARPRGTAGSRAACSQQRSAPRMAQQGHQPWHSRDEVCPVQPGDGARAGAAGQGNSSPGCMQSAWMCLEGNARPQGELCAGRAAWGHGLSCGTPQIHLHSAAPPSLGMEVMAPPTINALNGSSVKLSCTFNSCYKVENKQFSLNWTYQECSNCSEELVSLAGGPGPAQRYCSGFSQGSMCREGVLVGK